MSDRIGIAVEVCERSQELVRNMALRCGAIELRDDWRNATALITDSADLALAAAEDQKRVLFLQPWDTESSARLALAATRRITPAHPLRFRPDVVPIKQATDTGKLGQPGLLRMHHWWPGEAVKDSDIAQPLDLALWLLGDQPSEIYAVKRDNFLQIHLGFQHGAMALIDIDACESVCDPYDSLHLIGSNGAAYADDHHNMNLRFDQRGTTTLAFSLNEAAIAGMIAVFVRPDGSHADVNWIDTETAFKLTKTIHRATAEQQVVQVSAT